MINKVSWNKIHSFDKGRPWKLTINQANSKTLSTKLIRGSISSREIDNTSYRSARGKKYSACIVNAACLSTDKLITVTQRFSLLSVWEFVLDLFYADSYFSPPYTPYTNDLISYVYWSSIIEAALTSSLWPHFTQIWIASGLCYCRFPLEVFHRGCRLPFNFYSTALSSIFMLEVRLFFTNNNNNCYKHYCSHGASASVEWMIHSTH